jgi:hypothetical protein
MKLTNHLARSKEAGMWQASALELELPEFPYGSVWLVVAGDSDPRHLSPLAMHALATADPMIHDLAVPQELLDLRPALLDGRSIWLRTAPTAKRRLPPLGFSMSGLAG